MPPCPTADKPTLPGAGACGWAQSSVHRMLRPHVDRGKKSLCLAWQPAACFISAKEVVFAVGGLCTCGEKHSSSFSQLCWAESYEQVNTCLVKGVMTVLVYATALPSCPCACAVYLDDLLGEMQHLNR